MKKTITLALIFSGIYGTFAQSFMNLDFEDASLSGYSAGPAPTIDGIPGWTAYFGGTALTSINYDVYGGTGVFIYNSTNLEGNYYVDVVGTLSQPASIGQTGTIPATAESLIWWGFGGEVTFNGRQLAVSNMGGGAHYAIFAADVSAFAGQTGQLLFTSTFYPSASGQTIDNIHFSLVPEPSVLILLGLGGVFFLANHQMHPALRFRGRRVFRARDWRPEPVSSGGR